MRRKASSGRPSRASGSDGDKEGWVEFLRIARELLDQYAGIRFVHWASYEKTKIKLYMERYPDTDLATAGGSPRQPARPAADHQGGGGTAACRATR